ncbi:serine hydrolase domain-containing protein [Plantactinospora sp. GCM10030261]|uniref:serine hydrolase domain-containing protein n=1 Tax=Plantactinospora sp. GCM10030261 TaxID=3273420 RepID=UPI003621E1E0
MTDPQIEVQKTIDELVDSGREIGVQVAAYRHGELIVDACAGVADPVTGRPVTPDTPFHAFSVGKGLTSTVVHVLAERGQLDYDLRIADVWPEFARHGKDAVTLRHALTHSAGVPALPADTTLDDFTDWDRMCAVVAAAEPEWRPGSRHGYHVWTWGWLVGEVVRRVTDRTISQVLAEDVAGPLGVPDELFLGVPEEHLDRVARLVDRNWSDSVAALSAALPNFDRAVPPGARPGADSGNSRDLLRADIPAVGTASARAVAKLYAALLGEVDGVRLISPARLAEVSTVVNAGPDWTFGMQMSRTLGYGVEGGMFGAGGIGGSLAGAAPESGLAVAAMKNSLSVGDGDPMEQIRTMLLREGPDR